MRIAICHRSGGCSFILPVSPIFAYILLIPCWFFLRLCFIDAVNPQKYDFFYWLSYYFYKHTFCNTKQTDSLRYTLESPVAVAIRASRGSPTSCYCVWWLVVGCCRPTGYDSSPIADQHLCSHSPSRPPWHLNHQDGYTYNKYWIFMYL